MSMRGKDRWETRYKAGVWWHENREWVGLLGWVGGVLAAMTLILTFLR